MQNIGVKGECKIRIDGYIVRTMMSVLPNGNLAPPLFMSKFEMRYTPEEKNSLHQDAQANGFRNSASYVKYLIKQNSTSKPNTRADIKISAKYSARTRLNEYEKSLLIKRANEEGVSESFVVLRQLRIFLTQDPHFNKTEILALRLSLIHI